MTSLLRHAALLAALTAGSAFAQAPEVIDNGPATADAAYSCDIVFGRHQNSEGGQVAVATPAWLVAGSLALRGDLGYGSLLFVDAVPTTDGHKAVGVTLASLGGSLFWHPAPASALPVYPGLGVDAVYANVDSHDLTSRRRAVGARAQLSAEVPLTPLEITDDDDEPTASFIVQYGVLMGLPRADKLAGQPNLLNGAITTLGLRFYF